jgi:mannose-6-phosphate isomerase-like protein (cupin superfamily)
VSCHVSVLSPGCCPHPPHHHREEEVLVLLEGAAELVLVDGEGREEVHVATPGVLSYYPGHRLHTLRTTSGCAATYLMLRWTGRRGAAADVLPATVWRFDSPRAEVESSVAQRGGFAARTVFEGATGELALLHCHTSAVAPGAGYEPHVDQHDVVFVVMSGAIETLGGRIEGKGVVFVPAGVPHGLRNPGRTVASYLVFELHGSTDESTPA